MAKILSVVPIVAGLGAVLLTPARAEACSCISPGPACENYWKVEYVFDGTALASSDVAHRETVAPGREFEFKRRVITFKVHRAYKGVDGPQVEVVTGLGGGDCGYDFKPGIRYLVFASRRSPVDGRIEASICSATRPYDEAPEAVRWLDALSASPAGGRVYGSVVREDRLLEFGTPRPPRQPLDGVTIVLSGPDRERRTVTRGGQYRFSGLPPGEYLVRPELPAGLWRPAHPIEASLPDPRACAERDIFTAIDGRITGLLMHHDGTPAANVMVEATPADSDLDGIRLAVQAAHTDESGRFEIERLPAGRYVVGVNLHDRVLPTAPYPRTLFPGSTPDRPAVADLGPGESATIGTLTLAPAALPRHIRGTVVGVDGKPARNVTVMAEEVSQPRRRGRSGAQSTSSGAFEIRVRSNGRYVVSASLREGSRVIAEAASEPLHVTDSDVVDVRLVLKPTTRR